jgi:hypothetical protein
MMGFYFRKSVSVGPLRFNFSKSGMGVSTGIPGLRIGTGPRGHYVHAGRGGFYYRATLPSRQRTDALGAGRQMGVPGESSPYRTLSSSEPTLGPAEQIESGSVLTMSDETSEGLLRELNEKRARLRITPLVAGTGLLLVGLTYNSIGSVVFGLLAALVLIGVVVAWNVDALRKSTVIMYDMGSDALEEYKALAGAMQELGRSQRLWHVGSRAAVRDTKYHAGATSSITRKATAVTSGLPSFIKCNLDVPAIGVGRQTLHFFPDRLLVFDSATVGAISYGALSLERNTTRFVEEEGVPGDSRVVDQTWRYVNRNGGPDRRFKDNRQIPICEYEALHFSSGTGLNELLHASRVGAGEALSRALGNRGRALPS